MSAKRVPDDQLALTKSGEPRKRINRITDRQKAVIATGLILGQFTRQQAAKEFNVSEKTILRIENEIPNVQAIRGLASKTLEVNAGLSDLLVSGINYCRETMEYLNLPATREKFGPKETMEAFEMVSTQVFTLANAAERAAALQVEAEANRLAEEPSGWIAGALEELEAGESEEETDPQPTDIDAEEGETDEDPEETDDDE